jgi:hypothetical protein
MPKAGAVVNCLATLRTGDGAYANERSMPIGTTPTTAAVAVLLRRLGRPIEQEVGSWLLARCRDDGGFEALPGAPVVDLLSTATALHALALTGVSLDGIRERSLKFLDALWTGRAFRGHLDDDVEDCEYTFYGLLAMGHLSS